MYYCVISYIRFHTDILIPSIYEALILSYTPAPFARSFWGTTPQMRSSSPEGERCCDWGQVWRTRTKIRWGIGKMQETILLHALHITACTRTYCETGWNTFRTWIWFRFFFESMGELLCCIGDLTMSRFSFPDQVPKFQFFVIEGKEPGERDVPAPCFWQDGYVVMIHVLLTPPLLQKKSTIFTHM